MRRPLPFTAELVLAAYAQGIFPMAMPPLDIITWHCPDPRAILPLTGFHCSRSLERTMNRGHLTVTFNTAFREVMLGCADRPEGTWINDKILDVYCELHERGQAHSVEVWSGGELAGGTYGVQIGAAFMAESKFHRVTDASKMALFHLVERLRTRGFQLLDVQFLTPHLATLGVIEVPAEHYLAALEEAVLVPCTFSDQ